MSAKVVASAKTTPTLVLTSRQAVNTKKAQQLTRKGVELVACKTRGGKLVLGDCMSRLAERGVTNLLVEGGPTILDAMFKARLVDEVCCFEALDVWFGKSQRDLLSKAIDNRGFEIVAIRLSGDDIFWRLRHTAPRLTSDQPKAPARSRTRRAARPRLPKSHHGRVPSARE